MDKCIQSGPSASNALSAFTHPLTHFLTHPIIGSGSYKLSWSSALDANNHFTRNTTYYSASKICEGESDPDLFQSGNKQVVTHSLIHSITYSLACREDKLCMLIENKVCMRV